MPTDKRVDKRSALFDSTELESAKKLSDEIKKLKKEHKEEERALKKEHKMGRIAARKEERENRKEQKREEKNRAGQSDG